MNEKKPYSRAKIHIETHQDMADFIALAHDVSGGAGLVVEDSGGSHRVSAGSLLGMIYASAEFDAMYLVSTQTNEIPRCFDRFREM